MLKVNQGSLYPALLRLEQRRRSNRSSGVSENNRKARFYSITPAGRRQLAEERAQWALVAGVINRLLGSEEAMPTFLAWVSRLFGSAGGGRDDAAMAAELAFHLEMQERLEQSRGVSAEEAHRRARTRLGGVDQTAEHLRD